MSRKALEDQKFELIKSHILNPGDSSLPKDQQDQLNRVVSASKLLEQNPIQKNAVALLIEQYDGLSKAQAYEDIKLATRLFNSLYKFDFDFWHSWLINDIADLIKQAKENVHQVYSDEGILVAEFKKPDFKAWNTAHANLIKALGDKPRDIVDPKLTEKHNFFIQMNIANQTISVDLSKLLGVPVETRKKLADSLINEISDKETDNIMNS